MCLKGIKNHLSYFAFNNFWVSDNIVFIIIVDDNTFA